MAYLKVRDEEFEEYRSNIITLNNVLEGNLKRIEDILEQVLNGAITSGEFHTNLEAFLGMLHQIDGELGYLKGILESSSVKYISEIDRIDEDLY